MNGFTFTTILSLLVSTSIVQAGAFDSWNLRNPSLTEKTLYGVAYGSGEFVAAVSDGTVLISADGVDWSRHQTGATNLLQSIAYGNGQFVAVSRDGSIATSADGVRWFQQRSGTTPPLQDAVYANGQFVVVSDGFPTGYIVTSADGTNWLQQYEAHYERFKRMAYGNGRLVAIGGYQDLIGDGYPIVLTCADGTNWAHVPTPRQMILRE